MRNAPSMLFGTHPRTRDTWGVRHISTACCWQQANYMHSKFWRHLGVGAANLLHAALSSIWRIVQIEVEQHYVSPHSTCTFVWHWYACSHTKCSCHTKTLHLTAGHFFPVHESEAKHLSVKYSAQVSQIYAKLVNVSMTAVSEWAWQLSLSEQMQRWMIGDTTRLKHCNLRFQWNNAKAHCIRAAEPSMCPAGVLKMPNSLIAANWWLCILPPTLQRPALQWNKYKTSADAQKELGTHRVVQSCVQSSRDEAANVNNFLQCPPKGCISLVDDASRHILKINGKKRLR